MILPKLGRERCRLWSRSSSNTRFSTLMQKHGHSIDTSIIYLLFLHEFVCSGPGRDPDPTCQWCGSGSGRIDFISADPDRHRYPAPTDRDPDPYPFQPNVKLKKNNTYLYFFSQHYVENIENYDAKSKDKKILFSKIPYIKLMVKSASGSGSASKWKVGSESGSASKWKVVSGSGSASKRCRSPTLPHAFPGVCKELTSWKTHTVLLSDPLTIISVLYFWASWIRIR
jgi:hypothetical protein